MKWICVGYLPYKCRVVVVVFVVIVVVVVVVVVAVVLVVVILFCYVVSAVNICQSDQFTP